MMKMHESRGYELWAPVLGRILIAALFIMGGIGKIMDFSGSMGYAQAFNVPFPEAAILLAIIIELGGGLLLLFGFWTRFAAFITSLFLIVVTLIFHSNFAEPTEMIQFLKNFAIIGGLFYVSVYGARKAALQKCNKPQEQE